MDTAASRLLFLCRHGAVKAQPKRERDMIAAIAVLFIACAVAGGFIGRPSRHAIDGAFMGLVAGPLGILALWFCRDGNWS
jgi:hypothetical protein